MLGELHGFALEVAASLGGDTAACPHARSETKKTSSKAVDCDRMINVLSRAPRAEPQSGSYTSSTRACDRSSLVNLIVGAVPSPSENTKIGHAERLPDELIARQSNWDLFQTVNLAMDLMCDARTSIRLVNPVPRPTGAFRAVVLATRRDADSCDERGTLQAMCPSRARRYHELRQRHCLEKVTAWPRTARAARPAGRRRVRAAITHEPFAKCSHSRANTPRIVRGLSPRPRRSTRSRSRPEG
jgi:hypothetical protein